ncbi:MAG: GTPase Era [Roseiflexaceae bacterium]|nr:GTPase Era [Roseiflexaceae bacterium]
MAEPAILDFDMVGMIQGAEVQPAKTFGLTTRLERLAPYMLELGEDDSAPTFDDEPEVESASPDDDPETELVSPDHDLEIEPATPDAINQAVGQDQAGPGTSVAMPASAAPPHLVLRDVPLDAAIYTLPPASQAIAPIPAPQAGQRSGFVAIVGKPNVGKSTLLNALLGEKVAITSPKPQTTRMPMRGILNRPDVQLIFVDTPGIHDPRTKLGTFMVDQARRAIPDADIICLVVDISEPPSRLDRKIAELVRRARAPKLLVLNKVDLRNPRGQEYLVAYRDLGPWDMELAVSATKAQGLETLVEELVARLPEGGQLYPAEQRTDTSERERSAEMVREQVLYQTEQEVPHSVAIEVEEWEDKGQALYMRMTIHVEKDSQKAILIGAKGARLKEIGSRARRGIEQIVGKPVYLDLWVKTRSNWRDDASSLRWLGYTDK